MATGQKSSKPPNRREKRRAAAQDDTLVPGDDMVEASLGYHEYLIQDYSDESFDWKEKMTIVSKISKELADLNSTIPGDDKKTMRKIVLKEARTINSSRKTMKRAKPLRYVIDGILSEEVVKGFDNAVEQASGALQELEAEQGAEIERP